MTWPATPQNESDTIQTCPIPHLRGQGSCFDVLLAPCPEWMPGADPEVILAFDPLAIRKRAIYLPCDPR